MGDKDNLPGPRRRRIQGRTLEKRKVSMTPEEGRQLDIMAEKLGISVSELLVSSTLSTERENRRVPTAAEARALAVELTETRKALCELVVAVKNDERSAAIDEYMRTAKATSDRLYNAVEGLVR